MATTKNCLLAATLLLSLGAQAAPKYYTLATQNLDKIRSHFSSLELIKTQAGVTAIKIDDKEEDLLAGLMKDMNRAGFVAHRNLSEALDAFKPAPRSFSLAPYTITETERVNALIEQVDETELVKTITKLSSYNNRHHKAATGKESQNWVKDRWTELTQGRSDAKVELFAHTVTTQPSVILTITGSKYPDEIVVIGGHGDSLSGYSSTAKAPGADDNASGVSCITEIIRILVANNYKPERTIKFMSYAGEEGGLLGSGEVAKAFKAQAANVIGMMNLDMTNYKGSVKDIYMMNDNTNAALNTFVGSLIDTYVKVSWGYDKCGYGCSDHASWYKNGYASTIPFESSFAEYNHKIHSANDTLDVTQGHADHSVNFAKLGLSFAVELAK